MINKQVNISRKRILYRHSIEEYVLFLMGFNGTYLCNIYNINTAYAFILLKSKSINVT